MAAVVEQESETQLCNNCKKDIPVANFTIHEIHCSRNIGICHICKESFPKSEMRDHLELEHTQVVCKCSMKMDSGCLQEHLASECPLRPVACQHCDIELAFNKLQDHEDYCGARTERCSRCSRNILLRDLKEHPEDCKREAEEARVSQARPCLNSEPLLHSIQTVRNVLHPDNSARSLPRLSRFPESRLYNCLSGGQLPGERNRRNVAVLQPDQNQAHLEKMTSSLPFGGEPDCNLDYLLALSLQQENSSHDPSGTQILQRDLWKNICPARAKAAEDFAETNDHSIFSQGLLAPANQALNRPKAETQLPCEFCEELFPEEDLILHQTGCNPVSALASFSKRSSFVPPAERLQDLWQQLHSSQSAGSRESVPLQHDSSHSLMLPCEFCGVQLEEEILFHHQDQCDLRPATAPSIGRAPSQQGTLAGDNLERTSSPDLPRRRIRHQGELSPQYLEEFRQQKPLQPIRGNPSRNNLVAARRIQQTPPNNTRDDNLGPSERGKPKELGGGGGGGRVPSDHAAAPLPTRRCPFTVSPSGYVPSFPVTVPARPSLRREGVRSPASPSRYNNTKVKPWQAESDYPDKEQ